MVALMRSIVSISVFGIRSFQRILNYSVKAGYISISPMYAVDPPRMDTPEAAFLETTDIARVINAIDHLQDPMYKAFFQLELCTS